MPGISGKRSLLLIVCCALAVRAGAAVWWEQRLPPDRPFALGDSESYWQLAAALTAGRPYEYGGADGRIFRAPGYPLLLSAVQRVFGTADSGRWSARFTGAVLGTATVGLLMIWAHTLFADQRASLAAGWLAAFYPGLIALSILVLSEALFCPLMVGQLICWTRAEQSSLRSGWWWSAAAGALGGAATLARPSWLLFVPFAGALGLLAARQRMQRAVSLLIMVVALALVMTPWWIRNYHAVQRFVPTTLQVGASLFDGLNPRATGASDMWFVPIYYQRLDQQRRAGQLPADVPFEVLLDNQLRHDAVDWARAHPLRALQLAGIKFLRMWNVWPNDEQFRGIVVRLVIAAGYVPVLLLAIIGSWQYLRRGFIYALGLLPAVYLTSLHVIFVSSLRYREPAMMGAIILAAGMLGGMRKSVPRKAT